MKIGIDISQAVYEGTGVARFTEGLTRAILQNPHGHSWTFFYYHFRRNLPESLLTEIQNAKVPLVSVPLPPKAMSFLWNDLHTLSIDTFVPGLDWFITSDWTEPPAKCKKATIVHDLAFKRFPETIDETIMSVMQKKLSLVSKESSLIFADSEATKTDLVEFYHLAPDKIQVNYPGVTPPKPTTVDLPALQKKFGFTKPYILTVGKLEPRKNLARLFEAFSRLNNPEIELVVVGQKGWGSMPAPVKGVHMAGFVSENELTSLYQHSLGLVFPSLWEGFGYPAVEAMLLGIPTALSGRSSLAEIGNSRALLFDPESVDGIFAALQQLISDEQLRHDLSNKGLAFSKMLTWDRYLQQCVQTLEKV
jgi:glycosyltransferase involved in cell wall biosynthesis